MKRFSFLMIGLFVISIGILNAQTNQGSLLVSLSSDIFGLGYTYTKTKSDGGSSEGSKYFNVNLSPQVGYFVIDNLVVGLDLTFGFRAYSSGAGALDNTVTTINAGPFARYYIPTSKVLPFLELGSAFGTIRSNTTTINYGGGIGLAAPLGDRVMADLLLGYHSNIHKNRENNTDNLRTIMNSIGLNIGFVILLSSN